MDISVSLFIFYEQLLKMKRSQKLMLYAIGFILLAHFFGTVTNNEVFNYGYGPVSSNAEYSAWSVHPWYLFVPAMAIIAYIFYTRSPQIVWYWVIAILCLLLNAFLGIFAFIGIALAFYAVYLKHQEGKEVAKTK